MDEKCAMKILGLGEGYLLSDVKSAYRTLAKEFHPDRLGCGELRHGPADRMIDINLAFSFLIESLDLKEKATPKKESVKEECKAEKSSSESECTSCTEVWYVRFFRALARRRRPVGAAFTPRPEKGRRVRKTNSFADVFENCVANGKVPGKKNLKKGSKAAGGVKLTKVDYRTYIALKKKMRRRERPLDSGRVEPISPVSKIGNR